jgi:hypothetical protein
LHDASEVDSLAYAAWQYDHCPVNCLPLYRHKVEVLLLVAHHLGLAPHAWDQSAPAPDIGLQPELPQ